MKADIIKILESWMARDSIFDSTEQILAWIRRMNEKTTIRVDESPMRPGEDWYFNQGEGCVENRAKSFFSLRGLRYAREGEPLCEQPIIFQPEIGFLGIICKEFDGIMYFLMQAKVEPGNVNCVQISPTIQATKSNFQRAHGGKEPNYLHYFRNSGAYTIIFDQVQSEQGMRFYKKRNRNIMIRVDEDVPVKENFKWMTLGQIKELMKRPNLVNMDTRTVLSCIPISTYRYSEEELKTIARLMKTEPLFNSMFLANIQDGIGTAYNRMNNLKMFMNVKRELVPLQDLKTWELNEKGIFCKNSANFDVRYYDIEISGREVRLWKQPLVRANGVGTFGLMFCEHDGMYQYLVSVRAEVGAFDSVEIGPTVFREAISKEDSWIAEEFDARLARNDGVVFDSLFSEEGGRFYHEQNRNVLMKIDYIDPSELPEGYFWMSYSCLNDLVQINNCLNIQLRNLLSILDV